MLGILLSASAFLTSCASVESRIQKAAALSAHNNFEVGTIQATPFNLYTAQRLSKNTNHIHIVIEGDGFAWMDRYTPSDNPTPRDAVGLKLATTLAGQNVIYLARPCHYIDSTACAVRYWTSDRFAPEVLKSMNIALDKIKAAHNVKSFALTGYSGGAYIAMRLAARRSDVRAVNTVAGLLDPTAWTRFHGITPLRYIPAEIESNKNVTYAHACGADDGVVPCALIEDFVARQKAGGAANHSLIMVPDEDHSSLWSSDAVTAQAYEVFLRP